MFLKRYKLIFPSEHGSWSLMITPFIIGTGVAAIQHPSSGSTAGALLCLLAVFAVFFIRQPVALLIRIQRGKGRKADAAPARAWAVVLAVISAAAGTGLLLMGRWMLLWLALPAVITLGLTLVLSATFGQRQLLIELLGVTGLALGAPAAYISSAGELDSFAWLVWIISAVHNLISVLYVRLRIDTHHRRSSGALAWWVVGSHFVTAAASVTASAAGLLPWLISVPLVLLLIRSVVTAVRKPAIADVRRFGFAEMGFALLFAAVIITAYVIG